MQLISRYTLLLLVTICCCYSMAKKDEEKKPPLGPSTRLPGSSSKPAPRPKEDPHSHEHSHSKEHSHEHAHSKERSHEDSHSEEKPSKVKAVSCADRKRNQDESDVDCGGNTCAKCLNGKTCNVNCDCVSGFCKDNTCAQQSAISTKPAETTTTGSRSTEEPKPWSYRPWATGSQSTEKPKHWSFGPWPINLWSKRPRPERTTSEPATPESTSRTANSTSRTAEPTTPEPTTTEPTTPESTTPEPTTPESTTPESTTPEPTTPELTTTEATTPEPTTFEAVAALPFCEAECQNNGVCIENNVCSCSDGFSGPTCEIQSVGLCLDNSTFNGEPILSITFGNGAARYSNATPSNFDFTTTYTQRFEPVTNDGMFSFMNVIPDDFNNAWHSGSTDHTNDEGGYMYVVNARYQPDQFYNGRVDNLCVGLRYEFSVYLANLCRPSGQIKPNVLFEVRSTEENILLAQLNSGDIAERDTLTWEKYGLSFIAPSSSVNLLMISNAPGGSGNDLVLDDIALRVCASTGNGFCPSK